ncbi:hypothetical protein GCM10007049_25290 [Echinicola pacifica]|uniref:Nicotinate-nucleotide--dimethylbenzimidazole phosphoribosyltransferase n=1 Tax=Echinicola pacifica TaxID=346377 RepID=A0A918Q491_9BACT|nr:nicotinate-nucleotide--dimethylbenzimidazole phosphoribosyltransferase [Echinicola pacifica]GGZ31223.1 hypothetical protein GCM10007049_25290 [Echinicola pacifica]
MIHFNIPAIDQALLPALQAKVDSKTKPLGSLGKLEEIAIQLGLIQQRLQPRLQSPHLLVFAGDHGIAKEGIVNPYPQEVTLQMVHNFLQGGAAVNVFARQHNIQMKVVDAGVNGNLQPHQDLISAKIAYGTKNYREEDAMSLEDCHRAIAKGAEIVEMISQNGCNIIGFGEMGIGNTSSSALLMHYITDIPLEKCIGKGTSTSDSQYKTKVNHLKKVLFNLNGIDLKDYYLLLSKIGGFEIAQMCGGMLRAAELGMTIMVDGFISSIAALIASKLHPTLLKYCIFVHCSEEKGHQALLEYMGVQALLSLNMRLGEGSGIAVCYPIIDSACRFLNEMASFEDAGVSDTH